MHTSTTPSGTRFHHNSDFSGDIQIVIPAARLAVHSNDSGTAELSAADILAIAEDIRAAQPAIPGAERIGTNSGHGHVWDRPDGARARCGGPGLCGECRTDERLTRSAR